jgi:hypothetical protein
MGPERRHRQHDGSTKRNGEGTSSTGETVDRHPGDGERGHARAVRVRGDSTDDATMVLAMSFTRIRRRRSVVADDDFPTQVGDRLTVL